VRVACRRSGFEPKTNHEVGERTTALAMVAAEQAEQAEPPSRRAAKTPPGAAPAGDRRGRAEEARAEHGVDRAPQPVPGAPSPRLVIDAVRASAPKQGRAAP